MKRARKNKQKVFRTYEEIQIVPFKFNSDFVRQVYYLALLGATDKQIAVVFGVAVSSVENWKRDNPEFLEALQKGKLKADAKVAHSLFQSALGYSHSDTVILTNRKKEYDGKTGKVIKEWTEPLIVDTTKHYPPNVTAAIRWLSSRQPDIWADKSKLSIHGNLTVNHEIDLTDFSEKELKVLSKLGMPIVEDVSYEEAN